MAQNLLLLQLSQNEFHKKDFSYISTSHHSWVLETIFGSLIEMPHELESMLHDEKWHAQSYTSQAGRLVLVLNTLDDGRITRIVKIELLEDAKVARYRELHVGQPTEVRSYEEHSQYSHCLIEDQDYMESLLVNWRGDIIHLRKTMKSSEALRENQCAPCLTRGDPSVGLIDTLTVEVGKPSPNFVYAGRFVCWRETKNSTIVLILDTKDSRIRSIDLNNLHGTQEVRLEFNSSSD